MFSERLYLTAQARQRFEAWKKRQGYSWKALARALGAVEKTVRNWRNASTSVDSRHLRKLCALMGCSVEELTGERFEGEILKPSAVESIERAMRDAGLEAGDLAADMEMDPVMLNNWLKRYSAVDPLKLEALALRLGVEWLPLTEPVPPVVDDEAAGHERQWRLGQMLRRALLGAAVSGAAGQATATLLDRFLARLDQGEIDRTLRDSVIPEKHAQLFRHDPREGRNYYAEVLIRGPEGRYVFSFLRGSQPVDYGEVTIAGGKVTAVHGFSGVVTSAVSPPDAVAKVATWFGEGGCWFAVRSEQPFTIEVRRNPELNDEAKVLRAEDRVAFFR